MLIVTKAGQTQLDNLRPGSGGGVYLIYLHLLSVTEGKRKLCWKGRYVVIFIAKLSQTRTPTLLLGLS